MGSNHQDELIYRALDQLSKHMIDQKTATIPDPIWRSWRSYAALSAILTFWQASSDFLAKVRPLVADGMTPAEAIEILNQAGPMVTAANDLWIMAGAALAFLFAAGSKVREYMRARPKS